MKTENDLLQVFLIHRANLLNAARPIVGCSTRAEDVVQDVYFKIYKYSEAHTVRQPLSFLYRMVRNLALDRVRRQNLENRYTPLQDLSTQPSHSGTSLEDAVVAKNLLRIVEQALSELPPRNQEIFQLVRVEGYTQQEAAEHLGVSASLVCQILKSTLTHCRNRLRELNC